MAASLRHSLAPVPKAESKGRSRRDGYLGQEERRVGTGKCICRSQVGLAHLHKVEGASTELQGSQVGGFASGDRQDVVQLDERQKAS